MSGPGFWFVFLAGWAAGVASAFGGLGVIVWIFRDTDFSEPYFPEAQS